MNTIIVHSDKGADIAQEIIKAGIQAQIKRSPKNYKELWAQSQALIFIGALGICVREIAPFLQHKTKDPAVINIDANGQYVQPVVSGHIGGANQLAGEIARLIGAVPIITTVSDTSKLWPLDTLHKQFGWKIEYKGGLTQQIAAFVNRQKTALLLEIRDKGTLYMESNCPPHVDIYYKAEDIEVGHYSLVIAVTPFLHDLGRQVVYYRPPVLYMGIGCQKDIDPQGFEESISKSLLDKGISPLSIACLGTVDIKANEQAFLHLSLQWDIPLEAFKGKTLATYDIPNPSEKVSQVTGSYGVAEAAAMHLSNNKLRIEKTKGKVSNKHFTYAIAIEKQYERKGFIEFVGAGPGDPELVSVRGKHLLQIADLILYAGSLVPKELTHYAKPGCMVKSSAGMDLEAQIATMKPYYEKGMFIVRLHTGDPCIYGAIQEQMSVLDKLGMDYAITPGISSFQAAAARLKSQFTIPEEVQTIILTRGEGRTPMPEREQLHKLAASQSTMCIYLSASIASKVEKELLEHYPTDTPVAVCYKLTWKEEKIFRCTLGNLAKTVEENKLSMTTLIVVGKSIDNRSGLSKLYHKNFAHAYRNTD